MFSTESYIRGMEYLVDVVQKLSLARTLEEIIEITRHAARELTGADGAAFVLRDEDRCYYVDEDAIGPLWKGSRFPMSACISGWAMMNRESVAIKDIFNDPRIPVDAYRVTFVKSLLVVPIRKDSPIGAIGNYWAQSHTATPEQIKLLEALASSTSIALENVQLLKELKEANTYLAESVHARDEFFSIASHELRTPMSAITLELQMAQRKMQKVSGGETPLQRSIEQVKKLNSEIELLFDVNRIRTGQMGLTLTNLNVSELVKEEIQRSKGDFELAKCQINTEIEPDITAKCDPEKMRQILRHLFSNVIRHAPNCAFTIVLAKTGNNFSLIVKDSGSGISPELREKLMVSFERGHTPRRLGGLGLGLFIVRNYIDAHHGQFHIHPAEKGANLEVVLPL